MDSLNWVDAELERLERLDLLRQTPPGLGAAGGIVQWEGRKLLNFASNDYLGLAADPRLAKAAATACQQDGVGRGASPLIFGKSRLHQQLEQRIATFEQTEAALLFPSGFAANSGVIPALVDRGDIIYSDAHNHASIVDGCRLSRATCLQYPHGDVTSLEQLLQEGSNYRRRLIVTDTLFSMNGNFAPLPELARLSQQYDAMFMVDEAHATGVFGPQGRGLVEHFSQQFPELHHQVHVRVGTLSKALGSAGGFVCGSAALIRWLTNRARPYVFSTAHPAAASAAALVALDIVEQQPQSRTRLLDSAAEVRTRLHAMGWDTGSSVSQIIPVKIGSASATMQLAAELRERGLLVGAVRPPSVPVNASQLRIGISAIHTEEMLERLLSTLELLRAPHA